MRGRPFSARPQIIQGNFQGRHPSFVLQPHAGVFPPRPRAPHVQAAIQRHVGPRPSAPHQPRPQGHAFEVPQAFQFRQSPGGKPLPEAVQRKMEAFFKTDFSDVRIHEGPQAGQIGALAFTMGSDLYFAPGQYNPNSAAGQRLLGHELAHVVQQRQGRVMNPFGGRLAVVQDPQLESEAERMGLQASTFQMPVQAKPIHPHRPVVQPTAAVQAYFGRYVASGRGNVRDVTAQHTVAGSYRSGDIITITRALEEEFHLNWCLSPTKNHVWGTVNGQTGWIKIDNLGRRLYESLVGDRLWNNVNGTFQTENTANDNGNSTYRILGNEFYRYAPVNLTREHNGRPLVDQVYHYNANHHVCYISPHSNRPPRHVRQVRVYAIDGIDYYLELRTEDRSVHDIEVRLTPTQNWSVYDFEHRGDHRVRYGHTGHEVINLGCALPPQFDNLAEFRRLARLKDPTQDPYHQARVGGAEVAEF